MRLAKGAPARAEGVGSLLFFAQHRRHCGSGYLRVVTMTMAEGRASAGGSSSCGMLAGGQMHVRERKKPDRAWMDTKSPAALPLPQHRPS